MPADNTNDAPQSSNVVADPWGKAQVAYKSSNAPVRTAPSTDEIFSEEYKKAGLRPANENRAPDQTRKAHVSYAAPASVPRTDASRVPKVKRKQAVSTAKLTLARVRVTTTNAWIGSWAMFWYLTF